MPPNPYVKSLEPDDLVDFTRVGALGQLMSLAVATSDWRAPDDATGLIGLTDVGKAAIERVMGAHADITEADAHLAALSILGGSDPYIDLAKTDTDGLLGLFDPVFRDCTLQLVWSYGHVFAQRMAESGVTTDTETLTDTDAKKLLSGVPQAVAQLGDVVAGPFGITRSAQQRRFPPALRAGPVPCSDPGCTYLHAVKFPGVTCPVHVAEAGLMPSQGDLTGWRRAVQYAIDEDRSYLDDLNTSSLPVTLANAFTEDELREVLAEVIDLHPDDIRARAAGSRELTELFRGSGRDIARDLSVGQALQLLLMTTDSALVSSLESVIDSDRVHLPPTEVRGYVYAPSHLSFGFFQVSANISQHGVAFIPQRENLAHLRLERLIKETHRDQRDAQDLAWNLRTLAPPDSVDPLDSYLRQADPREVLQRLVLRSGRTTEAAFAALRYGAFEQPDSPEAMDRLVSRLLWKLGYSVPTYPAALPTLWQRLATMRRAVSAAPEPYTEAAQEAIRGHAVNFFVSAEEVLDLALSFVSWALLSDHYGRPLLDRFSFNLPDARKVAAERLNGRPLGTGENLTLRADEKNTLFPLVEGFRVLAEICDELLAADSGPLRRATKPFFSDRSQLKRFPFLHTVALLDLAPGPRAELLDDLRAVPASLSRDRVLDVRNRLEHRRESFPTRAEIEAALDSLERVIRSMEGKGLCPTVFRHTETSEDAFGRRVHTLTNYAGASVVLREPSALEGSDMPLESDAQVWLMGAQLADTTECLRFSYVEASNFQRLWRDFPLGDPARLVAAGAAAFREGGHTSGDDADVGARQPE